MANPDVPPNWEPDPRKPADFKPTVAIAAVDRSKLLPTKKPSRTWLWIVLAMVVVGGGVAAYVVTQT